MVYLRVLHLLYMGPWWLQGVIAEVREDNIIRSVREDSESSCVGEIAFFMGIAQPRTFQVCSLTSSIPCSLTLTAKVEVRLLRMNESSVCQFRLASESVPCR